jgi:hypothetical protein
VLSYDSQYTRFEVKNLYKMLEGQVAVLSTGRLDAKESEALLRALQKSALYRPDLNTYLLYPDRKLPDFLEKGIIPADTVKQSPLLTALLEQHDTRLIVRDTSGTVRFQSELSTTESVIDTLNGLESDPRFVRQIAEESEQIKALYEQVFEHTQFTGRSGTMFGYEGLGCTYWHMISKLLLAAQETCLRYKNTPEFPRLADYYYQIRQGLGFNKTPREYGAFPTDPYSHTPARGGAKQPGMTGQVKEEILTRFSELGVWIQNGTLQFLPNLLRRREFLSEPASFDFCDLQGIKQRRLLQPGELAFTFCQTPIIYRLDEKTTKINVVLHDEKNLSFQTSILPEKWSSSVFLREEKVKEIRVSINPDDLLGE